MKLDGLTRITAVGTVTDLHGFPNYRILCTYLVKYILFRPKSKAKVEIKIDFPKIKIAECIESCLECIIYFFWRFGVNFLLNIS